MASLFRCSCGHQWNADMAAAGDGATVAFCPVCQSVGAKAAAPNGVDAPTSVPSGRPSVPTGDETIGLEAPAAAPAELPAVAGYEVLAELGRGAMGVVYQARQLRPNRVVALKMVLAGAHAASSDLRRFLAEAEAAAQLQHANIVQVHEVGSHGGLPFISLEYVDGGTLAQKLKGTPLPPKEAAVLTATLGRAVQYAHRHGVVHRDLKPGNVLLTADGAPKIADFGLAKCGAAGPGMTQAGAILGTPSYMAPEQAEGKADVGPAADVYALGAILYELLTGRPPFQAPTPLDTVLRVVNDEPVPPRKLQPKAPSDLETICLKCLQKDPRKRYASAAALADDLDRFLGDRPILARPVGRPERAWRWCRRNPVVAGMAATLAAGALVAVYFINAERTQTLSNLRPRHERRSRPENSASKDERRRNGRRPTSCGNRTWIGRGRADSAGNRVSASTASTPWPRPPASVRRINSAIRPSPAWPWSICARSPVESRCPKAWPPRPSTPAASCTLMGTARAPFPCVASPTAARSRACPRTAALPPGSPSAGTAAFSAAAPATPHSFGT